MATAKKKLSTEEIKKHEENNEWWWVAEEKRSDRLNYLRKAVWKKGALGGTYAPGIKICMSYPQLFAEAWKQHEGDPIMLRKANAMAHIAGWRVGSACKWVLTTGRAG